MMEEPAGDKADVIEVEKEIENQIEKVEEQNDEDDVEDGEEDVSDEDEDDKWIDVRILEKMTLEEVKQLGLDGRTNDEDKRLDPPVTKVIVRRLPPQITIEGYLQELSEIPSYNYIRLVSANEDLPSRIGKRSAIYINFDTEQEAFWFKEKYNKMKFFDERGNSYIACVDFSFFQDVAKDPPDDEQMGTLEQSDIFQNFIKEYEEDPFCFTMVRPDNTPTPEVMLEEILNKKAVDPNSTPLLQFLRERSEKKDLARKERELRRKERDAIRREAKEREKEKLREKREKERERRKEREREKQKERDKERRLRREREKAADQKKLDKDVVPKDRDGAEKRDKPPKPNDKEKQKENEEKGTKQKPSGTVTYSKSGNVTRWSENSGPRKNGKHRKEDDRKKSQEQPSSSSEVSSAKPSEKLPVEKNKSTNDDQPACSKTEDKSKTVFGKPFPKKETKPTEDSSEKSKSQRASTSDKTNERLDDPRNEKVSGESGTVKKKVVKKVIKVRKVVRDDGSGGGDQVTNQSETSEAKVKKIIRVVKKSVKADNGNAKPATTKKEVTVEKGSGDASTSHDVKGETEKDRKSKKGRPEIQIYRPGSLRGGGSKSSSGGDKDRSDNNMPITQSSKSTESPTDSKDS